MPRRMNNCINPVVGMTVSVLLLLRSRYVGGGFPAPLRNVKKHIPLPKGVAMCFFLRFSAGRRIYPLYFLFPCGT